VLKTGRRGLPPSAAADWEVPEEKTYGSFRCLGPKLTFLFEHEQERARGPNNRLNSVTDWAGRVTAYQYDNNGRLALTSRPDGTQETRRRSRKFAYP
jgi:YD repeat-containing protein